MYLGSSEELQNPHGAISHSSPRNEKILRNFDLLLPKFHFILSKFHFAPPWRKFIFHRAIGIFLARYTPRLSPPQALSADYHNFMRISRHQSKSPDSLRSANTSTFTFFSIPLIRTMAVEGLRTHLRPRDQRRARRGVLPSLQRLPLPTRHLRVAHRHRRASPLQKAVNTQYIIVSSSKVAHSRCCFPS